jgi:hypothetical protein
MVGRQSYEQGSASYDNIGSGILNTFDSAGSFGLATTPRIQQHRNRVRASFDNMHTIPTTDRAARPMVTCPAKFATGASGQFPQTFPNTLDSGGFAITWAWNIKTRTLTRWTSPSDASCQRDSR